MRAGKAMGVVIRERPETRWPVLRAAAWAAVLSVTVIAGTMGLLDVKPMEVVDFVLRRDSYREPVGFSQGDDVGGAVAELCRSSVPGWSRKWVTADVAPLQGKRSTAYVCEVSAGRPRKAFASVRRHAPTNSDVVAEAAGRRGCSPRVYAHGPLPERNGTRFYATVIEFFDGKRVEKAFLATRVDEPLARQFGRLVACVHGIRKYERTDPTTIKGWLGAASVERLETDFGALRVLERSYRANMEPASYRAYKSLYTHVLKHAANWSQSVLKRYVHTHGDLHSWNILLDDKGELKIVDFENAHRGSAITDLGPYLHVRHRANVVTLVSAYHDEVFGAPPTEEALDAMLFDLELGLAHQLLDTAAKCGNKRVGCHRFDVGYFVETAKHKPKPRGEPKSRPRDLTAQVAELRAMYLALELAANGDAALFRSVVERGALATSQTKQIRDLVRAYSENATAAAPRHSHTHTHHTHTRSARRPRPSSARTNRSAS